MFGFVNARRADRINAQTGHNPEDSSCVYWAGDFAGVNLSAVCLKCKKLS